VTETPDQQPEQPQQLPPFDGANPYALARMPTLFRASVVMTPDFGQVVCFTEYKPGSTDTTLLTKDEALALAEQIRQAAETIGGIVVAQQMPMPPAAPVPFPFHPVQRRS
jgi:hypothetical protein